MLSNDLHSRNKSSAWLSIDLGALAANYNLFKDQAKPGCAVAGVIKADGYGLGVDKVLATLENQDCAFYFVATLDEALHLRKLTQKPIAMFGGLYHGAEDYYIHDNIIPVLNSLADIKAWQEQTQNHDIPLPAIIHFDTGMNRLGLGQDETQSLLNDQDRLKGLKLEYFMSHFACADDVGSPMTQEQYERFKTATAAFPTIKKSLCNSAGTFRSSDYHFDLLRPGMALYGLNPTPEQDNPMRPVVKLETRILQIRNVKKGETVGYGAIHHFEKDTAVATVALGYADGFLRSLSGKGHLYYKDTACPIIGRVSMDLVTIDIGALNTPPQTGDIIEVLGPYQDADTLAKIAGTIGYEILTDLGRRYHRDYI